MIFLWVKSKNEKYGSANTIRNVRITSHFTLMMSKPWQVYLKHTVIVRPFKTGNALVVKAKNIIVCVQPNVKNSMCFYGLALTVRLGPDAQMVHCLTPVWSCGRLLVPKRMPTSGPQPYGYTKVGVPLQTFWVVVIICLYMQNGVWLADCWALCCLYIKN